MFGNRNQSNASALVTDAAQRQRLLDRALAQQREHAIVFLDADGRIVDWLSGAVDMFGWQPDEVLGETLDRIFLPADVRRGVPEWELRAARSYGKAEDDRWLVRKDGVRIWVSGVLTALRGDDDIVGFVKIMRDRTDLRAHIDNLQSRLEYALRVENDKHVVLGTLAHELRNPLGPLASAAQIIGMVAPDNEQIASSVQIIERQVRYLANLVKDLLEGTRVAVGKVKLHYEVVELRGVIDAAVETCSAALNERAQNVEMLLPDSLKIELDPVRIQQVLVNLITNSSKYSPPQSTIWIKANRDENEAVIYVEDHGRGIPAELLPRIFDLFTQAGREGENAGHGLGLGLALVKGIVDMHRGTVQAKSESGKGTEISVRLPLTRPATLEPVSGADPESMS